MKVVTKLKLGAATTAVAVVGVNAMPTHLQIMLAGIVVLAGAGWGWNEFGRTSSQIVRTGNRTRRKKGVASTWDIVRRGSVWSVRRKARIVRPSLRELSRVARTRLPVSHMALKLCRVGCLNMWLSTEDAIVVVGAPRRGKSGYLAARIIDAPGAVISTSTRVDLMGITSAHRASGGRPVLIYNPAGVGGPEHKSTLGFNPLTGCQDPRRATETATDMIPTSSGDAERWDTQARRVLAVLLHAAALANLPISVVAEWVAAPGDDSTSREVLSALRRSPDLAHIEVARQFLTTNDRTRSSITSSIMPALAWLTCPEAVDALKGGTPLNVAEIVANRGTIFLLGRRDAQTAGLLAALTGRIVRDARHLASTLPGGRLDPPLTLALDEAARIAPIDLPDISGDCGGTGITLLAVFQSRADIADRWGTSGAARLVTNCAARLLFGGCADAAELKAWSDLAGERDERSPTYNKDGKRTGHSTRSVPVLSFTQLANPGEGRAVVYSHNMPPVIGKMRMAWDRHDVRGSWLWRLVGARVSRWRAAAAPAVNPLVAQWAPAPPAPTPATPSISPATPGTGHTVGAGSPSTNQHATN